MIKGKAEFSIIFLAISLFGLFGLADNTWAAEHYVRAGATGANNGADWANAWTTLPDNLIRGDTYYIAGGNYGSYEFDDDEIGGQWITLKKATETSHGTDEGWQEIFGEAIADFYTNQPVVWYFSSGFYEIGGQTGTKDTGHGFHAHSDYYGSMSFSIISLAGGQGLSNFKFSHIEANHFVPCYESGCYPGGSTVLYSPYGASDIHLSNCYFHDTYYHANILTRSNRNILIENCFFENVFRKEVLSDYFSQNVTIINNILKNTAGTGAFVFRDIDTWVIANNLFYWTDSRYSFSDKFIGTWTADETGSHNLLIYGNTFANYSGPAMGFRLTGSPSGIYAYNNIFYNCSSNIYSPGGDASYFFGNVSHDYNWFYLVEDPRDAQSEGPSIAASELHGEYGSGNPFLDASAGNFMLNNATMPGREMPIASDLAGILRGADGVWDRGAYEFVSFVSDHNAPLAPNGLNVY